ncbi:Selenoprotein K, partial [Cucurbita argyrosperma subsp. argyrosperma]
MAYVERGSLLVSNLLFFDSASESLVDDFRIWKHFRVFLLLSGELSHIKSWGMFMFPKHKLILNLPVLNSSVRIPIALCYLSPGVVKSQRSFWRLKTITDFFWAIVNIIGVFFTTLFSMEKSESYRKGSGSGKKWDGGGPGGPGSGPYGGRPRGPPRGLDNVHYLPVARAAAKLLAASMVHLHKGVYKILFNLKSWAVL